MMRISNMRQSFQSATVIASLLVPVSAWSALSTEREITLQPDASTTPTSIERTPDGGYLVMLDAYPPVLIKLGANSQKQWSFSERDSGAWNSSLSMATSDRDGGVVICGGRYGGPENQEEMPGFVIRLNNKGREVARLDPLKMSIEGGPFFGVASCAPWGDGYVLVATSIRQRGQPGDEGIWSSYPIQSVVFRLAPDLSVLWRKPLLVQVNPGGRNEAPREMPGGDVVIPAFSRIVRLDKNGILKAQANLLACTWLRSVLIDARLRFACHFRQPPSAFTLLEYDNSFRIVSEISMGDEDEDLAAVCEMSDGRLALLGTSRSGPFVQLYSSLGKAIEIYKFPIHVSNGGIGDGVPNGPSELVVVHFTNQGDHLRSIVSWMKAY
jgi:hypothetical protein